MITLRRQLELETIFLLTIVAAGSLFFVVYNNNNYKPQFSLATGISSVSVPKEVVSPKVTVFSQISPDGEKKVLMKVTDNNDDTKKYDISTANADGSGEQFIFTKTLSLADEMSVPFNTWSPDDKYFFINGNVSGVKSVLVFNALGTVFSETEPYLEAVGLFNQKDTGNNFAEATGWASETLIIINTKKPSGEKGFSYWFEVPSKAVIQLSTEF